MSLLPTVVENNLVLHMVDEAFSLFGIDCKLFDFTTINRYLDDRSLVEIGVDYKILLQEYIDKKILNNIHWMNIEKGQQGVTAFAPIKYQDIGFHLSEKQVIELYNGDLWQITEINRTYLVGLCYILRLVPYREEANRERAEKQMKTNFVRTLEEEIP